MKTNIMVNGLPGNMATEVAKAIITSDDFELLLFAFTGENMPSSYEVLNKEIMLIKPNERKSFLDTYKDIPFISVDYTHPTVANSNCDFYCTNELPFVMGTTGGNRDALEERVKKSEISAIIAPNMAKQIVAFQSMMDYAAKTFPNVFKDYSLEITESHQKGKADTSGTAKVMINYFNNMGIPFVKNQIKMIREPNEQLQIGVPKDVLMGHGWHTYTLRSKDNNVLFQFTHNVNGRSVYANGTLDGLKYLNKKIESGDKGNVYSMIDVLREN